MVLEEKHTQQVITFETTNVSIREDGIVLVNVDANTEIDVPHVKQVVSAIKQLGKGDKFPLLIIAGEYTLPTPEARAYIATPESDPYAKAEAYVVKSFSQKLVGNVFLSFNKPARPTKIFTSEEKAVEWLQQFL
ncbi:MAG: hypothetical protein JNL69_02505 [Bacteroidia bacterium]|nr:hypothetical protein [Bacteroidia bacterium]